MKPIEEQALLKDNQPGFGNCKSCLTDLRHVDRGCPVDVVSMVYKGGWGGDTPWGPWLQGGVQETTPKCLHFCKKNIFL